ncbi:amidohydrolase family protein [Halanaerobiaceae bacterium Z-7014]|uniref:Amidohydrolase family protein n=1 Tax=Halonatronomonas betaini TaxID=2778430 RepID=A0A931AR70_9FIRM|nr:amidohydrolase family protein [Halonatronomonas betaini]MBF8436341.1 amidohydrolase family protein [Halonatronomonas betaini]
MKTVFKNLRYIDVKEERVIEDGLIIIEDGRIEYAGDAEKGQGADGEIIDLEGMTLLPGLVDGHIHSLFDASSDPFGSLAEDSASLITIKAVSFMEETVRNGIVAVRDMGGLDYLEFGLKESIDNGLIAGPEMQLAGKLITMTGGHGHFIGREVDSPAEARKAAREQLKAGVDFIKIMATGGVMTEGVEPGAPQLTEEEMAAAIAEAHKAGRKTASHAKGTDGIENAIRAGIDSIEHGVFLDDEAIELMLENEVYLVPTLAAVHCIVEEGVEAGIPEFAVKKSEAVMESHIRSFQMAREAGVKIAMGTDAGTPLNIHGNNLYEIELMVEYGMEPLEAIRAATVTGAEMLELDDKLGTLESGKAAHFVVIDGKPDQDIRDIYNVKQVYKDGRQVR